MGYNKDLFIRHPLQVDGVLAYASGHMFVRDKQMRVYPFKRHAWTCKLTPGVAYLCLMKYTYSGADTTSYEVHGARPLPLPKLKQVNKLLYERLLLRDTAGAKFTEDPLFIEVGHWIQGSEADVTALRRKLRKEHEALMVEAAETGILSPRLPFLAAADYSLVDMFYDLEITPEEASVLPAGHK